MIDPGPLGRLVNTDLGSLVGAPPAQDPQVEANVAAWGGSVPLLRRFAAHVPTLPPEQRAVVTALAAWRAGVVRMREGALAGARNLLADRPDAAPALGAALALPAELVGATLAGLAADPFHWPDPAAPEQPRRNREPRLDAIGGFVGFGGPFLVPPDEVRGGDRPDRFLVREGGRHWLALVDLCGAAFVPAERRHGDKQTRVTPTGGYALAVDVPGLRIWP